MANKNLVWSMLIVFLFFAVNVAAVTINDSAVIVDPVPGIYGDELTITATVTDVDVSDADGLATVNLTINATGEIFSMFLTATPDQYVVILDTVSDIGLPDEYEFTITATDDSGSSDEFNGLFEIVDETAPTVIVTDAPDPVPEGDDITVTATITDDIAVDNSSVTLEVFDSSGSVYSASLFPTGTADEYAATFNSGTDIPGYGSYNYTVTATDTSSIPNVGSASSFFDVSDGTPPVISLSGFSASPVIYGTTSVVITVLASDDIDDPITSITALFDANPLYPITLTYNGTPNEYTATFNPMTAINGGTVGLYDYTITATDAAGNTATSSTAVSTDPTYGMQMDVVDGTAPTVTDASVASTVCYGSSMTAYATASDDVDDPVNRVIMNIMDPSGFADDHDMDVSSSAYTNELTLTSADLSSYGDYSYYFYAVDTAGLVSSTAFTGTFSVVDCTPPTIDTVVADSDLVYGVDSFDVSADVEDLESGIVVALDIYDSTGSTIATDLMTDSGLGTYTITFPSSTFTAVGTYNYSIIAINNDGYVSTYDSFFDVFDDVDPTIIGAGFSVSPVIYGDTVDLRVEASDDVDAVLASVYIVFDVDPTNPIYLTDTSVPGYYTGPVDTLTDLAGGNVGLYDYTIYATDAAGNTATATGSSLSAELDVIDFTAPTVTATDSPDPVEYGDNVTINATVTDDVGVDASTVMLEVFDSSGLSIYGPTLMTSTGADTYTTPLNSITDLSGLGSYTFTVTASDTSGLSGSDSDSFAVVDASAPT
ncbi:hypothetical protein HZA99_04850, partial [Candidatus Woesearchaeota archaeon]|nr:hypothetical protein [Candidatus Woesearchaeota archaeon]